MRISDWSSDVCSSDLEPSEPLTGESEEPAGTVECLANARRRQLRAVAGKIDVETGVEIGAHRRLHIGMFEHVAMHGDVAAPGVPPAYGQPAIPARVAAGAHPPAGVALPRRVARQPAATDYSRPVGIGRSRSASTS